MKKISIALYSALALLLITGFSACKKDKDFEPKIFLGNEDEVSVSNKASDQTIEILSNLPWTATADVEWITVLTPDGEKGRSKIEFSVADNGEDERTGTITVSTTAGEVAKEIKVVQESGLSDNFFVKVSAEGSGNSWENATTLDDALKNAVNGSVIYIAAGTYAPISTISGGNSSDGGDVTFEIDKNITLIGGFPENATGNAESDPASHKTILTGKHAEGTSYHVVTISAPEDPEAKVVLKGLTITGGNASSASTSAKSGGIDFRRDYGGGMTIGGATVDIIDCDIIENKSDKFVAGLFIKDAKVTIKNSRINKNISKGNGAGIWANTSEVHIFDSEINENETPGTAAGVHGYPNTDLYLYNTTVANNKNNSYGAGVYLRQKSTGYLVNCLIYGNESTSKNGGGGVMMYDDCNATIISSTITGNKIAGPGGGVYRRQKVNTLKVYNSIISGNEQLSSSADMDVFEAGAEAPLVQSSINGGKAYDATGGEIADLPFNASTMLNNDLVPIGDKNPALTDGMDASALKTLGDTFTPPLHKAIGSDKKGNSREGQKVMGALIK